MTDKLLSKLTTAVALLSSGVAAHGYIQGIIADGVFYEGYRPSYQYLSDPPQVAGWSDPQNLDNGFISDYSSPNIICNLGATPGQAYATVEAGGTVELQWTPWPVGHLGPVITYLANCNGECTDVDKTQLLFNKIDAAGLLEGGTIPGKWAAAELAANNNSWTLQIPSDIAPGNYVLRNEIIALQQAMTVGGAQNYPMCVNLKVTGSGTDSLQTGTLGTSLYQSNDPSLVIDIYTDLTNYTIPGPPLIAGASNAPQPSVLSSATSTAPVTYGSTIAITTGTSSSTATASITGSSSSAATSTSLSSTITASSISSSSTATTSGPSVVTITVTQSAATSSSSSSTISSSSSSSNTSISSASTTTTTAPLIFVTVPITSTTLATTMSSSMISSSASNTASSSTTSGSMTTTSLASFPTTFQTFTVTNTSTSTSTASNITSTSTDLVTLTVTVPGVFAAPSTLTPMPSFPTATLSAGGFYPMSNGTSWNGTAWSSGAAWPSGTAWSSGAAWSTGASWIASQPTGTELVWSSIPSETAAPIDNGYKFKKSMRIVRRSNQ